MDTPDIQDNAPAPVPSVRESLAAAMQEVAAPRADAPAPAAAADAPPSEADKARDDRGRFAPKPTDAAAPKPASSDPQAPADKPAATASATDGPPASWKPEARDLFSKADPALQAYIRQREQEQLAGVQKLKAELEPRARFADEIWNSIGPYADMIRSEGGTPAAAVRDLLETAAIFRRGSPQQKQQALVQIAQQFGVPLPGFAAPHTASPAPVPDALQRELSTVKMTLAEMQQARMQEQTNALKTKIEQFKVGKAHFDAVAPTMGKLIEAGIAQDLDDAYERAIRLDPDIFAKLQAEQTAKTEAEKQERARAEAAKKRAAGASITGAPGLAGSGGTKANPAPTLRAELERAYAAGRA